MVSLTPFARTGALDEPGLRAHLQRLGASGIGVYLAGSGSGEGYTLSRDERRRVFAIGVEELGGKVPVRAMGVEPRTAADVVGLAEDAVTAGLDATQVYSLDLGHGYVPTGDEMTTYLLTVLDEAPGDLVLSTHHSVGYHYPPARIGELVSTYPNVIGVNVTHPELTYVAEVLDAIDGRADVHVGGPVHALGALARRPGLPQLGGQPGAPPVRLAHRALRRRRPRRRRRHPHADPAGVRGDPGPRRHRRGQGRAAAARCRVGDGQRRPRLPVDPERARSLVDVLHELGLDRSEGLA